MVRGFQVQAHQTEQGPDEPFGLPKRKVEHHSQGERGEDRQVRVLALAATEAGRGRSPGGERLVAEPGFPPDLPLSREGVAAAGRAQLEPHSCTKAGALGYSAHRRADIHGRHHDDVGRHDVVPAADQLRHSERRHV